MAILVVILSCFLFNIVKKDDIKSNNSSIQKNDKIELSEYMKSIDDVTLYSFENGEYNKIGMVSKDVVLHLDTSGNNYYKVLNLNNNYYVKNINLINSEKIADDDRYKKYIIFNENINSTDVTKLYDENDNLVYTINESMSLPIIVKDDNQYGVEFGDRLLYIKSTDDVTITINNNTDLTNSSGVGILNYHFFYDDANTEEANNCNEEICISKSQFEKELNFLEDNNILTIKSKELEMYIDGKIQLPKSVYITIDDGGRNEVGLKMLSERKQYATVFLITSWYDPATYYNSPYIELHSHGNDLHRPGVCPGGQGGAIKCVEKSKLLEDLRISREKLNGSTVFAYPFYEYNDYSIEILKEAGFTMAFVGEGTKSDNLVHIGMNKFKLPRFVMVNYTKISDLDNYLSKIKG